MSEQPYNPTKTPLTARENELLVIALQCIEGDFKVDYDKFAKMAEYDNKTSATTILCKLMKHKVRLSTIDSFSVPSSAASGSPKKRAAPKPKTSATDANANAQDEDGEGGAVKSSPKKRGKKENGGEPTKKRAKKAVKVEDNGDQEEGANDEGEAVKQEEEAEGEFFKAAVAPNGDMEA